MKKIITILIVFLSLQTVSLGQDKDSLIKVVDYSVFPIGAMRYPYADTLQRMFSMNFNWYGYDPGGSNYSFPVQTKVNNPSSVTPITDPLYYDTSAVSKPTYSTLYDLLVQSAYGNDIRVYMPGTSGVTQEYQFSWKNKFGANDITHPEEWLIDTIGTNSLDYVLSDLGSAQDEPYSTDGYTFKKLLKSHVNTFSYEFIFNLSNGLAGVGSNTPLYSIEYWIKKPGSTSYSLMVADTITKTKYNNLPIANTQVHSGENVGAERLYTWYPNQSNQYRTLKRILNLRDSFSYSGDYVSESPRVDVRIRTFKEIPIYVRGIRIRDWIAQRVLGGYADAAITSAITQLLTNTANANFKSWTIGNENTYKTFHAWCYVNNLLVKNGAPSGNILSPPYKSSELFMRILPDQMNYDPSKKQSGCIWDEQTIFTGVNYPSWAWNNNSNHSLGLHKYISIAYPGGGEFPPVALPGAMTNDSIGLYSHGILVIQDKSIFTGIWQDSIIGWSSENLNGGKGHSQSWLDRGKACNESNPNHKIPYYLMAQTLVKPNSFPLWQIDSLFIIRKDSLETALGNSVLAESLAKHWADSIYDAKIIVPYKLRHTGNNLEEDSLFQVYYEDRSPTPAEFEYQMWSGVITGMKGYCINVAYSDGIEQHGFLRDSGGLIIKSQDQKNYQINWYKLHTPDQYGASHEYGDSAQYFRSLSLLPGFKKLYKNIRTMITDELNLIAPTLAILNWKGTVSWHKKDSTPTYLSRFPIKSVRSKTVGGSVDSLSKTYVQLALFNRDDDSSAKYLALLNRRLWCNEDNNDSTDYRTISFQVDSTKFPQEYKKFSMFRISDVAGNIRDTVISTRDTFLFTVKPGQGKLFRIAPAIGLNLGEMATNTYNNARHIAPIETDTSVTKFVTIYERSGNIAISIPTETPTGTSKRITSTPVETVIDSTGVSSTPAVAYNKRSNRIGVVYAHTKYDIHIPAHSDTIEVFHRQSSASSPYTFFPPLRLDSFVISHAASATFESSPAITPANDSPRTFWISWRHPSSGGSLVLVDRSGALLYTKKNFHAGTPTETKFISLATHIPSDTCYIAWEEYKAGGTDIYYNQASVSGGAIQMNNKATIISQFMGNTACDNFHFPQITVDERGTAAVAWEGSDKGSLQNGQQFNKQFVYVRERRKTLNQWGTTIGFKVVNDSLNSGQGYTAHLFPNIAISDTLYHEGTGGWESIWKRIMWHDSIHNRFGFAQMGRNDYSLGFPIIRSWETYQMMEQSLEPALPMFHRINDIARPILYRAITQEGKSIAKITQYDYPQTPVAQVKIGMFVISLQAGLVCRQPPRGGLSFVTIKHDSTVTHVAMTEIGLDSNTLDASSSIQWNDNRFGTKPFAMNTGDTLQYDRYFKVGTYSAGDTAVAAGALADTNDYAMIAIRLRKQSDNSIYATLDSAVLTKNHGFRQTYTSDSSVHGVYAPATPPSGLVYLTIEGTRGNVTDSFDIASTIMYDCAVEEMLPPDDSGRFAYKIASPPQRQGAPVDNKIEVQIVPNPFHTTAEISVDVSKGNLLNVTLFDVVGKRVAELTNGLAEKEHYTFTITNEQIAEGAYFLRVQSGNTVVTRKVYLVK